MFSTHYTDVLAAIDAIDPIAYGETRNYLAGAVTRLSPYISRGVINTKQVMQAVLNKGYQPKQIDSFLKELAWRDYFQQVWIARGNGLNDYLKQEQLNVSHHQLPVAVAQANTGIQALDEAIASLYSTGYMHNHARMYVAALTCNVAQTHWLLPARWMYYYLLDADWASNACSWQWVAGSFSSKKYYANQENINRYCNTTQQSTFLDVPYKQLPTLPAPPVLQNTTAPLLTTTLPPVAPLSVQGNVPTLIYNFYNLDPLWRRDEAANRILLLEPAHFAQYPVSDKSIIFALELSRNIPGIQVYTGSFDELVQQYNLQNIYFKEHPLNSHYKGIEEPRDWMFENVQGYYPSFFAYWKKCEKQLAAQ